MLLSVIFSFRNEEDVLAELIKRTKEILQQEKHKRNISAYELIFVNDASTDRSLEILYAQAKDCPDIRIINMSRRFGVSPCVFAGLEYSSGEVVVYMDADLQDPPEVISEMLQRWHDDKADVVHTVRKSRKGESPIKLFFTRTGYFILHKVTTIRLPVEAGDFKLLSRRVVDHITQLREKRPFLRGLVCWVGFKQVYVPYHRDSRYAGKTKFSIMSWDVINNFLESALISFSSVPLRFASVVGFFSVLMSFLLLGHVVLEKLQGKAIPGWTALMVAIIFIGSIQLLCIGIIGMYLSSVYEEGKKRPNFIVESTLGFPDQTSSYSAEQKFCNTEHGWGSPKESG